MRALASSFGSSFISLNTASIYSPYVGASEGFIREAFKKARKMVPSILFFDEIDAIVGKRGIGEDSNGTENTVQQRILSTLLNEMDGIENCEGCLIVAATNRLDLLDPALLRPGRFDKLLFVDNPRDSESRRKIFEIHTNKKKNLSQEVDIQELANKTENLSAAEISQICKEAAMNAMRRNIEEPKIVSCSLFFVMGQLTHFLVNR